MSHLKNLTRIFIFLAQAAMLLNCTGNEIKYPSAPTNAKAGSLTLIHGTFKTNTASYKADYGILVVPENREKADSRLIDLPIVRIHAVNNNPTEPIFRLEGGPGLSNVKLDPRAYLLDHHDFVAVGYRGLDGSSVLDCPEVEKAFKGDGDDVLSEESSKKIGEAWMDCASRLRQQEVDINGYSIMEVIDDMESARLAFGYERINLLSMSYGTRVAYLYGLKHPNSIHRSVMIAVNPPGHMVWEPETIDAQLKYYADLWAKDSKMSARSSDLLATMRHVHDDMPRRWLIFAIDPGKVRIVTFVLLFHRQTAPLIFDAYVAAEHGDPSGLALMSMAYNHILPSLMTWGEMASKAVSADFDSLRDYSAEMDPPTSIIGSPMGKLLWGPLRFGAWPIKQIPGEYRKLQPSDVETLLISGSVDFSTPAEFATNELLPYLSRGKQIVLSEMGHVDDVLAIRPEATERLLKSFYETGIPDDSLCTYVPMDFNVEWGFPKIAKVGLGVVIGGTVIILGGLVWLIKSIK
jgi:pimeloyl-ACP methyl ester carboxylesterase